MQDLVPCILVTFEKEQIVVWRGKDYCGTTPKCDMETIFTVLPDSEAGPEENSNIDISDQGSDDESLVSGTVTPEVVC